jgi:post-segregation antitoxin (ccd killing protein)
VYLPDELGKQAKEAGLLISQLAQDAVRAALERRRAVMATLEQAEEIRFSFEDRDGRLVTGRVSGKWLGESVILTEDERLIVVDRDNLRYWEIEGDPEEALRDLLNEEDYIEAMTALGITPIVDI